MIVTGSDIKPKYLIILAIFSGLVLHIPYNFQFEIIPCEEDSRNFFVINCWRATPSNISSSVLWKFYGYLYQVLVKVIPTLVILILNLITLAKMRAILRRRRQLRNVKIQEPRSSETPAGRQARTLSLPMAQLNLDSTIGPEPTSNPSSIPGESSGTKFGASRSAKETMKQIKLNGLLITLASCHILTTIWGNAGFILWTVFPELWAKFPGRYAGVVVQIFSKSYFLHFQKYLCNRFKFTLCGELLQEFLLILLGS